MGNISNLHDAHLGLALTLSCQPARWAEPICEVEAATYVAVYDRMLKWLNNSTFDLDLAWHRLRLLNQRALRERGGAGVVIPIDYVGIEHRHANLDKEAGMKGVVRCWQGARSEVVRGIPHALITYETSSGLRGVLSFDPIHRLSTEYKSDQQHFLDRLKEVRRYAGPKAPVVADRQFDTRKVYAALDELDTPYVIRLTIRKRGPVDKGDDQDKEEEVDADKEEDDDADGDKEDDASPVEVGGRLLLSEDGILATARQHAYDAPFTYAATVQRKRDQRKGKGKRKVEAYSLVVHLVSDDSRRQPIGPPKTLIAVFTAGYKEPLVLLAAGALRTPDAVWGAYIRYPSRWSVEESIRQSKNRASWGFQFEDTRMLKFEAIQRIAFLAASYQTLLGRIQFAGPATMAPLLDWVHTPSADPEDWRYRLAHGTARYLADQLRVYREKLRRNGGPPPRLRAWEGLLPK